MSVTVWDWYTENITRLRPRYVPLLLGGAGPLLAIWGQWLLADKVVSVWTAAVFWLVGITLSLPLFRSSLPARNAQAAPGEEVPANGEDAGAARRLAITFPLRPAPAVVAAVSTLLAFVANSEGRFTLLGVVAWLLAVPGWFVALWDGPAPFPRVSGKALRDYLARPAYRFELSRIFLAVLVVMIMAGFFRYHQLGAIPPEMTSDHVEKLLDVNDVLHGTYNVFFPRNTGREALQFYFAAFLTRLLGFGPNFLILKLTSATAGLLTIPFIFLLGRELEDSLTGWLAALLAAIAFWPNAISRVGLRFPFNPVFVAPALYFVFRGLRRDSRNDFLWAGLAVGAGLHGYSPFRVMAVALGAIFAVYMLLPRNPGGRWQLLSHFVSMSLVTLAVFAPLLRYALDRPDLFWFRTLRSMSDLETDLPGPPLQILGRNLLRGLGMFNVRGDVVWVNTIPQMPVLDYLMGGLFVVGVAYLIYRLAVSRSPNVLLLLLLLPILQLPSTLSLAYPDENPSVARAGAAVVLVYLIAALPLALMIRFYRRRFAGAATRHIGTILAGVILLLALRVDFDLYFHEYPRQYVLYAQNASEIGHVIEDFAGSVGSYDTAFVRAYPYWVDTRAVGMYAGRLGWDQVYLDNESLAVPVADPRPKLFIVHPDDRQAQDVLRETYPSGTFSVYASSRPHHNFLMFLVPATGDLPGVPEPAAGEQQGG